MALFQQSVEKKREKEVRLKMKEFMKELTDAGMDKKAAKEGLEELTDILLYACILRDGYIESKKKISNSLTIIEQQLSRMQVREVSQCRALTEKLVNSLEDIFHECTIRKEDLDFASTYSYLKKAAVEYDGSNRIMLQSEFENLRYMLSETIVWAEPDFLALAYYCKHEDKENLGEMHNESRNENLYAYYEEHFYRNFIDKIAPFSMQEKLEKWIDMYITERQELV